MPLSEDEARILHEIENQLYASDPGLAKQVRSTTVYTAARRGVALGVLGVIVGLAIAIELLHIHVFLSFVVGFGIMFLSAWYLERNLRKLGRVSLQQVTQSVQASGLREYFNSASERARERMRRDDDPN